MIEKKFRDEKLIKNLQERMSEINGKLNSNKTSKEEKKALHKEKLENLLTFMEETKYPKSPEAVLFTIVGDRSNIFLLYTIVNKVMQTYAKTHLKVRTHAWSKQKNT